MTVELFLALLMWLFQLGVIFLVAAVIPGVLLLIKKRKLAALALAGFLLMECAVISCVTYHPTFICPDEFKSYVTEETQERLIALNRGIYSYKIPVFPVRIEVIDANEETVTARTTYLFFGVTETYLKADGPYQTSLH